MTSLRFLAPDQVRDLADRFGTPLYVYDRRSLEAAARDVLGFPNAFGLTARYAMKALPSRAVLRVFDALGLGIDASSGYEVERALRAGIAPERIQLTAQELPADLGDLVEQGVWFNACSVHQLEAFGRLFPGRELSVRINPGLGSGHNNRTNVGGASSSFGIWHEHLPQVIETAASHGLHLTRMHTHIGSGGDPAVWQRCAELSLAIAARLPDVTRLNLGGGFKVGRMPGEPSADLKEIGDTVVTLFEAFRREHGRALHLELEPGTYLVANAGAVLARVIDVVDTGAGGRRFVKVDTGMTEILRPSLYGAQHPMAIVQREAGRDGPEDEFVVAGHCCESGDILTPAPGDPEGLAPRRLPTPAVGDYLVIDGAGAYCSGLQGKNYNSFPEAAEVMIDLDGSAALVRRRQTLEQMLANEL